MSTPIIYQVSKLSDGEALSLFSEIASETGFSITRAKLSGFSIDSKRVEQIKKSQSTHAIGEIRVADAESNVQIYFRRGVSSVSATGAISVSERMPSLFVDEVHVEISDRGQDEQRKADPFPILAVIENLINKWSPVDRIPRIEKGDVEVSIARVDDLVRLHKSIVNDAVKLRRKIDEELTQRRQEQTAEFAELKLSLELELTAERDKLAKVQAALDETRASLDDRNHMHVRRELRKHISDEIASRVSSDLVGRKSQYLNWGVTLFSLVCALISGSYSAWQFVEFSNINLSAASTSVAFGEYLPWALLIRGSISASVTAVFLALTLMWLRRTYLDNVRVTHDLQRYALDINRASWVIETIMEMTTKEGRVLPDRWIEGVCFGLFRSAETDRSDPTPLEAWGTLLNLSGRAEIGPGGPKIEFTNSRQTRKAAKGSDE